jgi:glc operon protein GlcG
LVEQLGYGKDGKPPGLPGIVQVDGVIAFAGGLPIKVGDHHVGGIGVSGASADQDETCAQAGLNAVAADLK